MLCTASLIWCDTLDSWKKEILYLKYPSRAEQLLRRYLSLWEPLLLSVHMHTSFLIWASPRRSLMLMQELTHRNWETQGASLPVWAACWIDTAGFWHSSLYRWSWYTTGTSSISASDLSWIWTSDRSHWTSARKCLVCSAPDKKLPMRHGVSTFLPVTELYTFVLGACKKRSNTCYQKLPITKRTKRVIVEDILPILNLSWVWYPYKPPTFQSSWGNTPLWAAAVKWEESAPLPHTGTERLTAKCYMT